MFCATKVTRIKIKDRANLLRAKRRRIFADIFSKTKLSNEKLAERRREKNV